jgi:hypothetical protein
MSGFSPPSKRNNSVKLPWESERQALGARRKLCYNSSSIGRVGSLVGSLMFGFMSNRGHKRNRPPIEKGFVLHFRVCSNRRPARAQAGFVALLYVFLCTFGTLTHVHAWHRDLAEEDCAPGSHKVHALVPAILTASHDESACPFCEWQVSSVSTALPLFCVPCPAQMCFLHPAQRADALAYPLLASPSSRAPPTA